MTGLPSAGGGTARRASLTLVSRPARTVLARAVLGAGLMGGLVVASLVGSLLIMVSQVSDRAPPTPWEDGSAVLSGIRGGGRRAGACSGSLDPFRGMQVAAGRNFLPDPRGFADAGDSGCVLDRSPRCKSLRLKDPRGELTPFPA